MLPRFSDSTKFAFTLAVIVTLLALLVAWLVIPAQAANEMILIDVIEDDFTSYAMSGSIEADIVEVTLKFNRSTEITTFGQTGGSTVNVSATFTATRGAILQVASARAQSNGEWRNVLVVIMSATRTTPTPSPTVTPTTTAQPTALITLTPFVPTSTVTPLPTITLMPVVTPNATVVANDETIYLPMIAKGLGSGE